MKSLEIFVIFLLISFILFILFKLERVNSKEGLISSRDVSSEGVPNCEGDITSIPPPCWATVQKDKYTGYKSDLVSDEFILKTKIVSQVCPNDPYLIDDSDDSDDSDISGNTTTTPTPTSVATSTPRRDISGNIPTPTPTTSVPTSSRSSVATPTPTSRRDISGNSINRSNGQRLDISGNSINGSNGQRRDLSGNTINNSYFNTTTNNSYWNTEINRENSNSNSNSNSRNDTRKSNNQDINDGDSRDALSFEYIQTTSTPYPSNEQTEPYAESTIVTSSPPNFIQDNEILTPQKPTMPSPAEMRQHSKPSIIPLGNPPWDNYSITYNTNTNNEPVPLLDDFPTQF